MEATTQAGITRRGFLKTTALVAGAATAAGLAGCQNLSEAPQEEVKAEAEGTQTPTQPAPASTPAVEEQTYRNICRGNCGGSNVCHLLAKVREGKIVHVMAEELEGEAGVIQAGCLKAATNPQRIYSSHRLLYPMVQKGERGSDNWERISWDEAFELMAEKLQAAFDEYGPESVGISGYGGNSIEHLSKTTFGFINNSETRPKNSGVGIERFVQKTGMTLFGGSGDLAQLYMQMTILQAAGNSAEDLVNSKTIFLWGSNPADATRYAWPHVVAAQEAGAKVIAIDPRFSNSAAHADMWIPIRPGTDGALVLAMCNYIVDNDLIDYDYLRNHSVAPLLVKEDGSYLRLSDLGRDPIEVTDAKGNTTSVDCEVVYDEANQTFGASREVTDPAVLGTFDAEGISVRTVYDYALEAIKPYTVEFAANECGIPQEKIAEITELYAKNTPAAWRTGGVWSISRTPGACTTASRCWPRLRAMPASRARATLPSTA